jgi:uncharacterized membrane protein YwzB
MLDSTTIILILIALATGFAIANYFNRQDGLTKTAMFWANYQEPLIYRQRDINDRDATIAAYDNAVAKLKEHGNQHIKSEHVLLWVYGAEEEKMNVDFAEWSFQAIALEQRIKEEYRKEKIRQARAAGNPADAAKQFAGYQNEDFNDIPRRN